jgi:general secretion pathway protein K
VSRKRSRGAALLMAMMTVTLVATLAAAALWQQWRSVEVEAADRSRVQSAWILTGALDWARLILREDARSTTDNLGEPWAVPLKEARLSTFLAADRDNTVEGGDADNVFLSGEITDLQSRLNVTSLVEAGSIKTEPLENFRRLFELLGLPQAQLARMAENLRFASDISTDNRNAGRAPLLPDRVEQLTWLGLSPETVAALAPYVTVLPVATAVNLNTAPAEVVYAVARNVSLADAQGLVAERQRRVMRAVSDALALLPEQASLPDGNAAVGSKYFEVRGRLRLDDVVIEERSLVERNGLDVRTVQRERGAFEQATPVAPR